MSCCSSGPKTPVFVGNKCALLWSWWAATTTYLKGDFYFAFVKVAVAMQNIHQFASNLMPLLMCLKLTLICCEVVPLIRNSLNSQPQIALAKHCRIPGDATPHSYCMSSPTVHRGRAIYHCTPLGKKMRKYAQEVVLLLSVYAPKVRRVTDMHIDDGDDRLSHALDLPQSKW